MHIHGHHENTIACSISVEQISLQTRALEMFLYILGATQDQTEIKLGSFGMNLGAIWHLGIRPDLTPHPGTCPIRRFLMFL